MTAGNSAPDSLFRSLGADDSFFETRARATSKEAEQRWPLFKAVAPSKAQETPEFSEQQRQASWSLPPAAITATQEPRLSRPGLNQKLANGLRELGQKTKQEIALPPPVSAPPAARARNLRSSLPRTEVSAAARPATRALSGSPLVAMDAAAQPPHTPARELLDRAPAVPLQGTVARKRTASAPLIANPAMPVPTEAPRPTPAKKGLFAQLAPAPEQPRAEATPAATTPLQGVFARLSADTAAPEAAAAKKRSSLFGRIGR